jgi:outer membrane protein insertion porin family
MRLGIVLGLTGAVTVCLLGPATVRAQALGPQTPEPPPEAPLPAPLPPLSAPPPPPDSLRFGGAVRYVVEAVEVHGNRKTDPAVILRELGLGRGDVLTADDPRVPAAELRLLSLGYFVRVSLRLKGLDRRRNTVALMVDVEERGTVILNALYLGTSEATLLWGGLDVSETNFLGRGMMIGGGVVASTTPTVPEAEAGHALTLRAAGPRRRDGLLLAGSFLYSDGSEFFQAYGPDDVDPTKWRALNTQRVGGTFTVGGELSRTARFSTDGRFELIDARLPSIRSRDLGAAQARPIDFMIHEGNSRLASLSATLDFDTRSDPVLPARGRRLVVSIEAALPVLGSRYSFAKGLAQGSFYFPSFRQHVIGFHAFSGAILGEAPYFDRFFIGDLNFLLPSRALGLNFATLPSRNFLQTNIASRRYESFAARALGEYAIPLWRGRGFVYRGDAFAAFGIFGLASLDDLRMRDADLGGSMPIDLTADLGLRLDTYIGIFTISIANGLGRIPF